MKVKFKDPEVRLLGSYDKRIEAWKISRPYLKDDEINLQDLEKMDLAVSGAASYSLYFRSSILFRDLLFTLRPAVGVWARSQRTVPFDEDNLFLSGEYEGVDDDYLINSIQEVYKCLDNGMPQDYAKKKLPMATSTEYSLSMDDRTLVTFLKVLKLHCKDLYDTYGKKILSAIGHDDSYIDNRNCKDIFDKLKVSESEYSAVGTTQECLEMFIGSFRQSNNLMAQFIRQHYSTVKNELYNKIDGKSLKDFSREMCDDESVVVLYADKESFKKVLSVRSCWFGQWDQENNSSWSSVVGPYVKDMKPSEFLALLPCKGNCNNCSIYKDMVARRDCIEVNPPCPILTQKPSLVNARGIKYNSDSTIYSKWVDLVSNGMIKDNKENRDRVLYEEALTTKSDSSEWGLFKNLD